MEDAMEWQMSDAKNRFSELISLALTTGAQRVKRRNQSVIIMAEDEYQRLTGQRKGFKEYLLSAPDMSDLDVSRATSSMRDVSL